MKQNIDQDKEQYIDFLKTALSNIKEEEDIPTLNEYRKIFRKTVPLYLRSYVGAYLSKTVLQNNFSALRNFRSQRYQKKTFDRRERSEKKERVVIDEEFATTIFVSIGKNRNIYPRDLIILICQNTGLTRERVGDIRILDNYSFVQVYKEDADTIINTLNGSDYRKRRITVSYSRKKEDAAPIEGQDD